MEVSRLRVELELKLQAYTTTTAIENPSHVCDLHHSSVTTYLKTYFSGNNKVIGFLKILLFYFLLFRATPAAYGNSQAMGQIGAAAAGLHHSHISAGS